jgi:phytoene dehydrogenase-like protein
LSGTPTGPPPQKLAPPSGWLCASLVGLNPSWPLLRACEPTAVADLMVDTVEAYAPGFKASVIARQTFSPLNLERTFGLPNGDIFHGAMTLDQLFSARPMLRFAAYRMPIAGLYLCGSGAHPDGGVTGAPGHNAAQAVIADLSGK